MNNCGIYCIKNIENGFVYIGQSKFLSKRRSNHFSNLRSNKHRNDYLQHAWNKYGEESFVFEILELCNDTDLDKKEKFYIKLYKSNNQKFGYNLDGGGNLNKEISDITRKKLSKIGKNKTVSPSVKERISLVTKGKNNPFYNKKHSKENRKKMSKSHTNVKLSAFHVKAIADGHKDIKHKDSTSRFLGVHFNKGRWVASIYYDKKHIRLGRFCEEVDAAKARDAFIISNNINRKLNFEEVGIG